LLFLVSTPRAEEPSTLFVRACSPCHGKDGKAQTPAGRKLKVKDLTQSKLGTAEIEKQIQEGKKGSDGLTKMPSFKESLKAEEIEALVRYVKALQVSDKAKPAAKK